MLCENIDATVGERARDVRAIGIDELTEENFRPDRDDLDARHLLEYLRRETREFVDEPLRIGDLHVDFEAFGFCDHRGATFG